MADPLSIAGSVVGITAAGVQASVKLYALAEKVATASQRVTSIADDISSTCAILNQVRELIIPQPDAQGTLKSVFNSVALNDISHALRRCRSSFTDIEALLRRAFEQVGKRPALRSNIKLSRFEQAKWPFLQPQFDELRNDLRDAKGNLVLMIAVASLALAQRDGRQRPIHETERLDLGSTIVQLQRASTVKTQPQYSSKIPRREVRDSQSLSTSGVDADKGMSSKQTPMFEMATLAKALPPGPPASEKFASPASNGARGISSLSTGTSPANVSQTHFSDAQVRAAFINTMPHPSLRSSPGGIAWSRQTMAHGPSSPQESHIFDQPIAQEPAPSAPSFESAATLQPLGEPPQEIDAADDDSVVWFYHGWTTTYLQGLATGHGDSLLINDMKLPQKSLAKLVKAYTDEGNDPHIAVSELTREQQTMIKEKLQSDDCEIVYVRLQRNITVSSVFGTLNVETLKWITTIKIPYTLVAGPFLRSKNDETTHEAFSQPPSVDIGPTDPRARSKIITAEQRNPSYDPSSPAKLIPPASSDPDLIQRLSNRHRRSEQERRLNRNTSPPPLRTHTLDTEYGAFDRTSVKFTDASKPGEYSRQSASEAAEHVDPSTSIPTEYNPDVDAWAAQYTDPSALIPPSMPYEFDPDLDAYAADSVDPATTVMPDADDESETYDTQPINPGLGGLTDVGRQDLSHSPSSPEHSPLLLAQNEQDVSQEAAVPLEGKTPFVLPYRIEEFGERDDYLESPSIPPPHENESFDRARQQYQTYHPYPRRDTTSSRSDRTGYNTVGRYDMPDGVPRHAAITPSIADAGVAEETGEDIVNELLARWTVS